MARRLRDFAARMGLGTLIRPIFGGLGAILVFHRVEPPDTSLGFDDNHRNCVAPDHLSALLAAFRRDRIDIVSLDEALERARSGGTRRFAVLTFDDGYRCNLLNLLPIAHRFAAPVTIYVAPGLLDGTAPLWWFGLDQAIGREASITLPLDGSRDFRLTNEAERRAAYAACAAFMMRASAEDASRVCGSLASRYAVDFHKLAQRYMLRWDEVRQLAASPLVTIGAHTMSHPNLACLDRQAAKQEMAASRDRLATETGQPVEHFAYPYGMAWAAGERERGLAEELGFRTAVTTVPGNLFATSRRHLWPRHGVGPLDGAGVVRLKLAGAAHLLSIGRSTPREAEQKQALARPDQNEPKHSILS